MLKSKPGKCSITDNKSIIICTTTDDRFSYIKSHKETI